jgi:signal transduction histidine kinase
VPSRIYNVLKRTVSRSWRRGLGVFVVLGLMVCLGGTPGWSQSQGAEVGQEREKREKWDGKPVGERKLPGGGGDLIPGLGGGEGVGEGRGRAGREGPIQVGAEIIPGITRAQQSALLPTLRTVSEVQALSGEQASQGYTARIVGVVTVHVPGTDQTYVQDQTGGIYVGQVQHLPVQSELRQGQVVEVLGKTVRGRFTKHLAIDPSYPMAVRVLGDEELPEPRVLSGEMALEARYDGGWSEASGVVRRVKLRMHQNKPWAEITLSAGNTRLDALCFLPEDGVVPESLVGAEVRLRGVPAPLLSERGQMLGKSLMMASPGDITVLRPSAPREVSFPVRTVASIGRLEIGQSSSPRVRVQGGVTFSMPGRGFYVSDGTGWIRVEHSELFPGVGSRVDVVGFAEWGGWSPVLQDCVVTMQEGQWPVEARKVDAAQLGGGDLDGAVVEMEGTLMQMVRSAEGPMLVLQSGGRSFEARFVVEPRDSFLDRIPEQSRVRVRGVLVFHPRAEAPALGLGAREGTGTVPFELWLASEREVELLTKPGWWNQTRITVALSILGGLALATTAWMMTLRARVAALTEINSAQRVREATFEERARVARELHDSVEQELAGLTIQLDVVRAALSNAPGSAAPAVETARAMLRHTREEARRSIWDLRSLVLERGDLAAAILEVCSEPEFEGGAPLHMEVSGSAFKLAPKTESNLVRICQEATSNARKYAKASMIRVSLEYAESGVILRVSDDGVGFDASGSNPVRSGHFGLLHMRERAEKIGADLQIESRLGEGTSISVFLPGVRASSVPA